MLHGTTTETPNVRAPGWWVDNALDAERAGDWAQAAVCWDEARSCSYGNGRRTRYAIRRDACLAKGGSK